MYQDARAALRIRGYASISELIRDALRDVLYPRVTENGFTPEFEEAVLRSAAQPFEKDHVLETNNDVDAYFRQLAYPKNTHTRRKK